MIQWLTRDWGLKLISLVLAIGLWYYAVGEEGIEVTRSVPLEIVVKNAKMSLLETSTETVGVTLVAPRALLSDLTSGKIRVIHEIGDDVEIAGDYSFRLEPREIKLPTPQIRVAKIEPETIHVILDELIAQKLKVKANFVGEPAFGYKVKQEEIQLDPNAVLIEGPKGQIEKLDAIKTEKLDLVGRIRSFRRTVTLDLPSNVHPLSETLIDVFVPIQEESEEKKFENVPLRILKDSGASGKIRVSPSSVSLVLKGAHRQLEKLTGEKIMAYVDTSPLSAGDHEVPVKVILPEDVALAADAPAVKVAIKK